MHALLSEVRVYVARGEPHHPRVHVLMSKMARVAREIDWQFDVNDVSPEVVAEQLFSLAAAVAEAVAAASNGY
eukprot:2016500-Amphidinium_carterae.1